MHPKMGRLINTFYHGFDVQIEKSITRDPSASRVMPDSDPKDEIFQRRGQT